VRKTQNLTPGILYIVIKRGRWTRESQFLISRVKLEIDNVRTNSSDDDQKRPLRLPRQPPLGEDQSLRNRNQRCQRATRHGTTIPPSHQPFNNCLPACHPIYPTLPSSLLRCSIVSTGTTANKRSGRINCSS